MTVYDSWEKVHHTIWAVIWGGAKRMGGGKRTRERALPKNIGLTVCKLGVHCKRRSSEKSTFLATFWGFLVFSKAPVL